MWLLKPRPRVQNRENVLNRGDASPQIPHFCVVEAKRERQDLQEVGLYFASFLT
jgi:hypothetical protein